MNGTEVVNYPFYISEYADKTELGKMEMGRALLIGDHGTITSEGYTKQARFIIQASGEERYVTWKIVD